MGDLQSYLVHHRNEFNTSLNDSWETGVNQPDSPQSGNESSNGIILLHRWTYQVSIWYTEGYKFQSGIIENKTKGIWQFVLFRLQMGWSF